VGWREVAARKNFWLLVAIYLPMMAPLWRLRPKSGALRSEPRLHPADRPAPAVDIELLASGLRHWSSDCCLIGSAIACPLRAWRSSWSPVRAFSPSARVSRPFTVGCALVGFGGGLFTLLAAAIATEFGAEAVGRAFGLCMFFIPLTALAPFAVAKTQESHRQLCACAPGPCGPRGHQRIPQPAASRAPRR